MGRTEIGEGSTSRRCKSWPSLLSPMGVMELARDGGRIWVF